MNGGTFGYERREAGCLNQLYKAFCFILSTANTPLTSGYIRQIHKIAAANCATLEYSGGWGGNFYPVSINPGTFKNGAFGHIVVDLSDITIAGYEAMLKGMRATRIKLKEGNLVQIDLGYPESGYEFEVNQLIALYTKAIQADDPYQKLEAIVNLVQGLEHMHPFEDGNLRTFATLIMNRELVKHGFYPSLMNDPNIIDGHSVTEVTHQVIQGMENFQKLKEEGYMPGTYPTDKILEQGHSNPIQALEAKPKLK